MRMRGDIIPGVGVFVNCHECQGAGWVLHESASGVRQKCARCGGDGLLIDDGAEPIDREGRNDG